MPNRMGTGGIGAMPGNREEGGRAMDASRGKAMDGSRGGAMDASRGRVLSREGGEEPESHRCGAFFWEDRESEDNSVEES